jgi:hypothetical protein
MDGKIMANSFSQLDLEKISAWMDGELSPEQEREVQQRIDDDVEWAQAYRQLQEVDKALGQWDVPAIPDGLASKIIRNTKHKPLLLRAAKWVAPLATAAVIVLMVLVLQQSNPTRTKGIAKSASIPQASQQTGPRNVVRHRVPSPQEQARLLENYSRRMQFAQQWMAQNEWLLVVLRSFTPEELRELKKLSQEEKTKQIIQRRDELVKKGILKFVSNPR